MTAVPHAPAGPPGVPPPGPAPAGPPATGGPPPAARQARQRVRRREAAERPTGMARLLPRTVAGRVRALTTLVGVLLVAVMAVVWVSIGNARDGVRVIGHDAGPQVVATGDLYFQLTDMDAQLANALLLGRTKAADGGREAALERYDWNRQEAGEALLKAARLADEPTEQSTAQDLLEALGRYERLAGQALLLDRQADHDAGPPSQRVTEIYRQATDLMKLDLLPKAYNLTLDNGTLVRHTYQDETTAIKTGQAATLIGGVLLLAALVGLQLFLAARFRRLLNPALAVATVAALALVAAAAAMLGGQAGHLDKAKKDGFDSILALSRARAIGNNAKADQTRFLLDPSRADTYEQVYLSKSQTVLFLAAGNLTKYNEAVQSVSSGGGRVPFQGFLGDEAHNAGLPGQRAAFAKVLNGYRKIQQDDREIRNLVVGSGRTQAIKSRDAAARDFSAYDTAMLELIEIHQEAFEQAISEGDDGTAGWNAALPAAGLVVFALVLLGVRPRLTEYR